MPNYKKVNAKIVSLMDRARITQPCWNASVERRLMNFFAPAGSLESLDTVDAAERFIVATKAVIRVGGDRALYDPISDTITVPCRQLFVPSRTRSAMETYYSTVFHEIVHWSGSPKRLNRYLPEPLPKRISAREELIAEMGAAYLCNEYVSPSIRRDHVNYVSSWLAPAGGWDVFYEAAREAEEAVDYLINLVPGGGTHA